MFEWLSLIPDFNLIVNGGINSTEGVSALIVGLLLVIFFVFMFFAVIKWFSANRKVNFFLIMTKDLVQAELSNQRNELKEQAKKTSYTGRLWREFDESLVYSFDKKKLSNTLDAAHFFNTHTLAQGLTENRMVAAVPGFLTAIGVIGTFLGLYIGLSGINLNTEDIQVVKLGINTMVQGAQTAFLTSVWGVFLSVSFNFGEKFLERGVRGRISDLQNQIDFLYPRINAEQSLVEIADHSQSSAETMLGLAEKIGDKMQETMLQVSETINTGLKDSLHEIMAPALEKMAMDAQSGSEKALDGMLTRFMDGFGDAGQQQRAMMDSASGEVNKAVGELGLHMSSFMERLDARAEAVDKKNELQKEQMKSLVSDFQAHTEGQQSIMTGQFESMMNDISSGVEAQMQSQAKHEDDRARAVSGQIEASTSQQQKMLNTMTETVQERLQEQRQLDEERDSKSRDLIGELTGVQTDLCARVEELVDKQARASEQMGANLKGVSDSLSAVAVTNNSAAKEVQSAAAQMTTVSTQLSLLGGKLAEATESLDSVVGSAATTTDQLSIRNRETMEQLAGVLNDYKVFAGEMTVVSEKLVSATAHAEQGFSSVDRHLQSFQQSLEKQSSDFSNHVAELLSDYSQKVSSQTAERLNVWNQQTNEYVGTMSSAIIALSSVVDEIEDKVSKVAN
jgi:hypothetical protein